MGLDHADHHVDARLAPGAGALQHLVGLADAGGGADEDLQPAARALLPARGFKQRLRRRTLFGIAALLGPSGQYNHPPAAQPRPLLRGGAIEREVQCQNVNPRFANQAEQTALGVGGHELLDLIVRQFRAFATRGT